MKLLGESLGRLHSDGKLTLEQYNYFKELSTTINSTTPVSSKQDKIALLSKQCQERIINGIDFTWDGETHHYSLDITDQMEINILRLNLINGATQTTWHYNGGQCEPWAKDKFLAFADQALTFATYTKVRFNTGIRPLIESMDDLEQINAITLDTELSAEVEANIMSLVSVTLTGQ